MDFLRSSGILISTACTSAVVLSIQRSLRFKKQITLEDYDKTYLESDTKRDTSVPFADHRLNRLTFSTLILTGFSVWRFKENLDNKQDEASICSIAASVCVFFSWLYILMLVLISRRHRLPDAWGWILNIHLFVLYLAEWIMSICCLWQQVSSQTNIDWLHSLSYVLPVVLGFDMVYVTITTKQGPPFLDKSYRQVLNINIESIIGIIYFSWCDKVIQAVTKKKADLTDKDLPVLTAGYRAHNIFYTFSTSSGQGLIKRLLMANKAAFIGQLILCIITSGLYYGPAFFINQFLQFLQDYSNGVEFEHPLKHGISLVLCLGGAIAVSGISASQQWFIASCQIQARVRSMLNVEVYKKALRRRDLSSSGTRKSKTEGEDKEEDNATATSGIIVNLMSTDASRVSHCSATWFFIVSAPFELIVGYYFLYQLMGVSCFYSLLVMVSISPLSHWNSKNYMKAQNSLMAARDKRVSLMNEVLQGIRQIKFFASEANWEVRIMKARLLELKQLKMTYINGIVFSLLYEGSPIFITLVTFFFFTKVHGGQLTAPIAFTVINVFNKLRLALNVIPKAIVVAIESYASVKRIEKFLFEEEIEYAPQQDSEIGFENATLGWKENGKENDSDFILKDVNFKFPQNELSLISGATGSGKTLLLLGLLREAFVLKGKVYCPHTPLPETLESEIGVPSADISHDDWVLERSLAYVSQTPWLQHASVRDNILFGLPYIESRYKDTIWTCALDKDLQMFEDGDLTEIGEKGITLSGGQKARIALARAVYSRAQNVLMDDILSAVDTHTAKHLLEKCLVGPLMKNRTRILVTYHIRLCLKNAGFLVHIENGQTSFVGTLADLRQSEQFSHIVESEHVDYQEETEDKSTPIVTNETKASSTPRQLIEEEKRNSGSVKLRIYKSYFGLAGKMAFWLGMVILIFGTRALEIGESWWIKIWAQSYDQYSRDIWNDFFSSKVSSSYQEHNGLPEGVIHLNFYLSVYSVIALGSVLASTARNGYLFWGLLRGNKSLYASLLHHVLGAPLRFFDTTPLGRILSRFSKDFDSVDSSIPQHLMMFIVQWINIFISAITVCIVMPVLVGPITIIMAFNIWLGRNYIVSSRELKRLDSVTRSPVLSTFTESVAGVATIRAFGASQQFLKVMMNRIDENVRPFFYTWGVNRWVSIRYALTSATVSVFAAVSTLWYIKSIDVALAGFVLSLILILTDNLFWGVRLYAEVEMGFNSIECVIEFTQIDQEAPPVTESRPPNQWPSQGAIQVKNLVTRYAADLEPVLRGISFSVNSKEKIGVVGRTGSGKSTLALSFFRFVEASEGSIVIDGINIKDLGTKDLRSNLTIIPQDPILFSGTLRSNMDPFEEFKDKDIFVAFRRVRLISENGEEQQDINANVFKDLDYVVSEGGRNFSQGQRQLLCFARALLKRGRIVVMDEATASVDFETDKAIQNTITTELSDSTILCIAHRLHTVIKYDRILVLDQGQVKEFDDPLTLIRNTDSLFYKMCRNSGDFESLLELAEQKE